jgi:hypothetical protein
MDDHEISNVLRDCGTIQRGKVVARVDRVAATDAELAEVETWVNAHRGRRRCIEVRASNGLRADRVLEPAGPAVSVFEVPIAFLSNGSRR